MSRLRPVGLGRAHFRRRLEITLLEDRFAPAVLAHSLYPSGAGPQPYAIFGYSVATDSNYRVVGAPYSTVAGLEAVGQAFVYDAATNDLLAVLNNPVPAVGDQFGNSVAVSGKYVVVAARYDDDGASDAGSVYIYDLTSLTPTTPIVTLNNPTPDADDNFGAAIAVSGQNVVVGAGNDDTVDIDAGSAYVYSLASMTPTTPIVTFDNPASAGGDFFGWSVAISGDTVVVGATQDYVGSLSAGSAYVYNLSSLNPTTPIVTLNNPTPASDDRFGNAVAVSSNTIVVGAYLDDTGATDAGSAYVYDLSSPTPTTPFVTLKNPTPSSFDNFGISVTASGNTVIIGAGGDDTGATNAGSAYVYKLSSPSPTIPIATLKNPAPAQFLFFGNSVAVSSNFVVVGAPESPSLVRSGGSAYVFDLDSPTSATPSATLKNDTPAASDTFGSAVAMAGNTLVVGVRGDNSSGPGDGSAYVYDLSAPTPSTPIFILRNPTPASGGFFGNAVAVSGQYVVVGASLDDTGAKDAGSAYVYDLSGLTPTSPIFTLHNPAPASGDLFGGSVAIAGQYVVVGAFRDDAGAKDAGSAYVYDLSSVTPTMPIFTFNNPSPASNDGFGVVAASGSFVIVSAAADDMGATDAGSAYVYDLSSQIPTIPLFTLNNPSPATNDYFGSAVAVAGKYAVVGAYADDTGATDTGSAHVYDLTALTPTTPIVTLNNPTSVTNDAFGTSVAVVSNTVVVGTRGSSVSDIAFVYDLGSMTQAVPITTVKGLNSPVGSVFGNSIALSGTTLAVGVPYDDNVNIDEGVCYVYALAAPRVANVQINAGGAQRSRVTSVKVAFDQPVSFSGAPTAAFSLKRQSDGLPVALNAVVNGNTVSLSFTGGAVEFGSLADGRYTLTIDASQVFNANGQLDGNGDGNAGDNYTLTGTPTNGLFRLFGDSDGDGDVDLSDFSAFRMTFGNASNLSFDADADGDVDLGDFAAFRGRFGTMI